MNNKILSGILISLALAIVAGFFIWPALSLGCMGGSDCRNISEWAIGFIFFAAVIAAFIIPQINKGQNRTEQNNIPKKNQFFAFLKLVLIITVVSFVVMFAHNTLFNIRNNTTQIPNSGEL